MQYRQIQNLIKIKLNNLIKNLMLMCFIFRGGKAFAAEQKIRAFKKILLISKQFEKMKKKQ